MRCPSATVHHGIEGLSQPWCHTPFLWNWIPKYLWCMSSPSKLPHSEWKLGQGTSWNSTGSPPPAHWSCWCWPSSSSSVSSYSPPPCCLHWYIQQWRSCPKTFEWGQRVKMNGARTVAYHNLRATGSRSQWGSQWSRLQWEGAVALPEAFPLEDRVGQCWKRRRSQRTWLTMAPLHLCERGIMAVSDC